jgi:hypothetical protein
MDRGILAAVEGLRALHRALLKHLKRFDSNEAVFSAPLRSGLSPEGLHRHLADLGEDLLGRLRVGFTQTKRPGGPRRSARQTAALKWAFLTWNLRPGRLPLGQIAVLGEVVRPQDFIALHTRWLSAFIAFLEGMPEATARLLTVEHPDFGELSSLEWAKFLRVYFRAKELEFLT